MSNGFHHEKRTAAERKVPVDFIRSLLAYEPDAGVLRWLPRHKPYPDTFDINWAGKVAGAKHHSGAIQVLIRFEGNARLFWAHRLAWTSYHGVWPDGLIDHEDGDASNNRIDNLRLADGSSNGTNKHVVQGGVPFRGVYCWSEGRFAAQIKKNGKWYWLGLHDRAEDAARAYDAAATELHGDFASTNRSLGLFLRPSARALL